jgi:hypothetical protein
MILCFFLPCSYDSSKEDPHPDQLGCLKQNNEWVN